MFSAPFRDHKREASQGHWSETFGRLISSRLGACLSHTRLRWLLTPACHRFRAALPGDCYTITQDRSYPLSIGLWHFRWNRSSTPLMNAALSWRAS